MGIDARTAMFAVIDGPGSEIEVTATHVSRPPYDIEFGVEVLLNERVSVEPGKFRVRGDCVEVFPSYEEFALRIESSLLNGSVRECQLIRLVGDRLTAFVNQVEVVGVTGLVETDFNFDPIDVYYIA